MPHFFVGRQTIGEPFEVPVSNHTKIRCQIFQRWKQKETYECSCGLTVPFKVTRTWGVSEKDTETLEASLGGSIGAKDIAQIKSRIATTSGHEIEWTYSRAQEMNFTCDPPACGRKEIRIYQLVYEYEMCGYSRGYLFKRHVWDLEWTWTMSEELSSYSCTCDTSEFDDRCGEKCKANPKPSPEFDGRLSLDLGPLSLRIPYKMEATKMQTRIGAYGIDISVADQKRYLDRLEKDGVTLRLGNKFIDPVLLFLSGLKGDEFEGNLKIYTDAVATSQEILEEKIVLQDYLIEGLGHSFTKAKKPVHQRGKYSSSS